ncbi:MAG: type II secretion system secretin GspD [Desulfobacteraceae bacterium]|nr:type II secretion system secretin GspD [Desulfobacteraceae bacterium]
MDIQASGKKFFLFCLFIGISLCFGASLCFAQNTSSENNKTAAREQGESVSIDFDNVDIKVFIKFISKLTNKNFVVDSRVKGNVTVISPTKISVKEAYKVFESVLEIHGYSTVTSGAVIKIVPKLMAKADNIDTSEIRSREEISDKLVTRIIRLKYAGSDEVKKMFTPLLSKGSVILSYRDTNMLIVTSSLASIDRLLKIIKTIDLPRIGKKISVIPVKNADASKLVKNLSSIFSARIKGIKGKADSDMIVQFVADERTNSVVLLATELETHRVERLIDILDQAMPKGDERIRVYYLENASAEDLAKVLQDLPTDDNKNKRPGRQAASILSQKVSISADKTTNSLIIMAEKEDYPVLEEVIAKLDIPRAMVYIECMLMEVNVTSGIGVGVEWKTGESDDGVIGFSGDEYTNIGNLPEKLSDGFSLGVLGKSFNIGGIEFNDISAIVNAYQDDKNVRILSTPQILTTENEEAIITVGKNVPYQTQAGTSGSSETTTYNSYEYKDVGITLKITPHISKGKMVRLEVDQLLTKLSGNNDDRPTTFKRQVQTTIMVENGYSVVIGGLIDDTTTTINNKTPCLGDIPGLGWAFKNVSESTERTNLYVFITPRVIRNTMEAQELYKEKMKHTDEYLEKGEVSLYDKVLGVEKKLSITPSKDGNP